MVAGVAALMLSVNPYLTEAQLRTMLHDAADKVGPYNYNWNHLKPGHSRELGYGRINAARAVLFALPYLGSYSGDATSYNNGHRMVKYGGEYHLVYESNGDILYTTSSDLSNWNMPTVVNQYLGQGEGHNPSITVNADGVHIVWYEINDDKTEIYYRHIGGFIFYWDPLYEFSPAKEVHPVIETNSQETGALRWIVTEGSDGLYYIVLNLLSLHAIPNTTSKSKFPSLQMRTNTFGVAYEENGEIYYVRYNPSSNHWYDPQLISSQSWQSNSHHPSVTGEYTSTSNYWIAWDDQGPNPSWETVVFRSETGTYYSFNSWLHFYYYPSIRSDEAFPDPHITLSFEEWYNHDVYYTNFNPSTGRWDLPILISNEGEKPNIALNYREITPEPSDIVWTSEADVPYRIQTSTSEAGQKRAGNQAIPCAYSRQINFDLSEHPTVTNAGLNLSGQISVEISPYQTADDTLLFEVIDDSSSVHKFFSSKPFTANDDSLIVRFIIEGRNLNINQPVPNPNMVEFLKFNLKQANTGQPLASLYRLTHEMLTSIGQNNFVVEKTVAIDLHQFQGQNLTIEEDFLKRTSHFNPIFIEKYELLPPDSSNLRKSLPPIATKTNKEKSLAEFELLPNYPNPFNPATTITFVIPEVMKVKLGIYDIAGRKIRTLLNNQHPAGRHQMVWDGRDDNGNMVASGIYIYRFRAGQFVQTRKMLLMK
jgi:hypothetical protein